VFQPRRGLVREGVAVPTQDAVAEFRAAWLPHVTADGLRRVTELLEKDSPLLIHGSFTRVPPMGCLASHIAWNHPRTCRYQHEAGVVWLTRVAGLNPATSRVVLAWDREPADFDLRADLLDACHAEQTRRAAAVPAREPVLC
jgi:hypothetical protein